MFGGVRWGQENPMPALDIVLAHNGTTYNLRDPYDYPDMEGARFHWESGNFACDCNRSRFIGEVAPGFGKLPCGETIDLVSLEGVVPA